MTDDRIGKQGGRAMDGIRRSFDIYYRDHKRTARMDRLNAIFVRPGDLVFDIGAHVGDRTGSFLRIGAKVVALEPQPIVFRALQKLYGRCERAHLRALAAGKKAGETELLLNTANPTVATVAADFVSAAKGAKGWEGQVWDARTKVQVTTLDALIEEHGDPSFVKIDVEGHEPEVLEGLSTALPLLSFEVTTIQRIAALACIDRLSALARYEFNISHGEEHALRLPDWITADRMKELIAALPHEVNSGDVYARLHDKTRPL
jgi:FkbM family methyltransferase